MRFLLPHLLIAGLVFFIFEIHMSSGADSMLNERNNVISNGFLTSQITYHKEFAPFARRPLTTFLIEKTSSWLGITLGKAFVGVNFLLLFLSGVLLFRLSRAMHPSLLHGIVNIIIYFLSFSILFAFFPPIFSYDEPLQYCLIFAGMTSFQKGQFASYILWFTAAMIARENTAFLIIGLALSSLGLSISYRKLSSIGQLQNIFLIGLPILLYLVFILLFIDKNELWTGTQDELLTRFSCFEENFHDKRSSIETIISFVLTLGLFIYFLLNSFNRHSATLKVKRFVRAFFISGILNTLVVLFAAFSKESRLFALPLVFLWPLMAQVCSKEIRLLLMVETYLQCFSKWRYAAAFCIFAVINYLISFIVYVPSFPSSDNYFNEYLFLSNQIMFLHYLLKHYSNRNSGAVTTFVTGNVQ
jgi:MFS family permease